MPTEIICNSKFYSNEEAEVLVVIPLTQLQMRFQIETFHFYKTKFLDPL